MHSAAFKKRLSDCAEALHTRKAVYRDGDIWSASFESSLESQLSELADLYWESTPDQRRQIRDSLSSRLVMHLFLYVRRVAILIEDRDDVPWLRRGLAMAAIENGRGADYRDLIVSLVILRHGAERVGIKTRKHFNEAIKMAEPEVRDILRNARDHRESDVKLTIREFGPPQWRGGRSSK